MTDHPFLQRLRDLEQVRPFGFVQGRAWPFRGYGARPARWGIFEWPGKAALSASRLPRSTRPG